MFGLISEGARAVFQLGIHPEKLSSHFEQVDATNFSFRHDLASPISGTKSIWRISIGFLKKEQMASSFGSQPPVLVPTLSPKSDHWA